MKKYLCLLTCILFCFMSACSPYKDTINSSLHESEYNEIIDSGKYYRIYKGNATQVCYNIYDSNGKIVLSETTERPLKINMLNDNIVDIRIGMGTGNAVHKYYNAERGVFSDNFSYVLSNLNELVAYIYVPEKNAFDNRKVVVQNVFDRNLLYKEYQLNFSNVDTPVIDAAFSDDGTVLTVVYLSGTEQTEKTETLLLKE